MTAPTPRFLSIAVATLAIASLTATTQAKPYLTTEHVDIAIGGTPTTMELHLHDEDNDVEYEPDEAFLAVNDYNQGTQGVGETYKGFSNGTSYYFLPATQDPLKLYLGVGGEEASGWSAWDPGDARIAPGSYTWLELALDSVSGPGQFSIWSGSTNWMSTQNPNAEGDELFVLQGGHNHYNYAFTEMGSYDVTFTARGWNGSAFVTDTGTFTFVVPEPASLMLLGLGASAIVLRRRRA